ncbi:hypothetical protein [Streptomyces cylindrosporus]|nr:hypothetical protein [Streptomyces cylindrosporus]
MVERTIAWLHGFRRLRIRWERGSPRSDLPQRSEQGIRRVIG